MNQVLAEHRRPQSPPGAAAASRPHTRVFRHVHVRQTAGAVLAAAGYEGRGGYAATVRGGDRDLGAPVDRRLRLGAAQAAAADGRRGETLSRHRKCGRAGVRQDDGVVGIDGAADGIGVGPGRSSSPRCRWCSHRRGRSCRSKPASTSRRRSRRRGDNRDDASGPAGQPSRACLRPRPAGRDSATGLPIGVLLTVALHRDERCLDAADGIERQFSLSTPLDRSLTVDPARTGRMPLRYPNRYGRRRVMRAPVPPCVIRWAASR